MIEDIVARLIVIIPFFAIVVILIFKVADLVEKKLEGEEE